MNSKWPCGYLILLLITPMGYADEEGGDQIADLPSEDCVNVRQIKKTEIADDRNILFHMNGGKVYRNRLPRKCFGLKRRDSFSYEIRSSRLCSIDAIRVLDQFGGSIAQGVRCSLGKFHPISKEEAAILMGDEPMTEPPETPDEDEND